MKSRIYQALILMLFAGGSLCNSRSIKDVTPENVIIVSDVSVVKNQAVKVKSSVKVSRNTLHFNKKLPEDIVFTHNGDVEVPEFFRHEEEKTPEQNFEETANYNENNVEENHVYVAADEEKISDPVEEPVFTGIAESHHGADQKWVSKINDQLTAIPNKVKDAFVFDGWHIYATTDNIDQVHFGGRFGSVMGVTSEPDQAIFIEDRSKAVREAPVHEFGHWLAWHFNYAADTGEFDEIYNAESDSFCNAFAVNFYYDRAEFFAEGFYKYCTDAGTLQANCPRLYQYIDNLINSL